MKPAKIHLLDMGKSKYGDCLLLEFGRKRILIDGGHAGDMVPRNGHQSIPQQLRAITGVRDSAAIPIDLLVVTHCHADHIGCLPALVHNGVITAEWALVADPDLGWGNLGNNGGDTFWNNASDDLPRTLVTALMDDRLREARTDQDLAEIVADAANLRESYLQLLSDLKEKGAKVVRYTGARSIPAALRKAFKDVGMEVLGPSREHLYICAEYLAQVGRDALDFVATDNNGSAPDALGALKSLLNGTADNPQLAEEIGADRAGPGAALNDQSIILKFTVNKSPLLLLGDMQVVEPEMKALENGPKNHMSALRARIQKGGPYACVKASHHTSYNGVDEKSLAEWGENYILLHSGGWNDPKHPEPSALRAIKEFGKTLFARTDRNGAVTVDLSRATAELKVTRGEVNNFSSNPKRNEDLTPAQLVPAEVIPAAGSMTEPVALAEAAPEQVEVITRVPHVRTKVRITVEVDPEDEEGGTRTPRVVNAPDARLELPARALPKLLFVTSEAGLKNNLPAKLVDDALRALRAGGHGVISEIPAAAPLELAVTKVHAALRTDSFSGVVLLGGYDVLPSCRVDVLTPALRQEIDSRIQDPDDFKVWSDAIYGDLNRDTYEDLPISRIPDGKSTELFTAALQARDGDAAAKSGIRNSRRPFAESVFNGISGDGTLLSSHPAEIAHGLQCGRGARGHLYLMLHGSDADGSALWGEGENRGMLIETFNCQCLPNRGGGVVFTGACWGALIVTRRACAQNPEFPPQSKAVDQSIALSALKAGFKAFIGCTGSHYSPLDANPDRAGGPLHRFFWEALVQGEPPARALFKAKRRYAQGIPYRDDAAEEAVDQKILRQFTCLGLGW